jgi:hypothetical protein
VFFSSRRAIGEKPIQCRSELHLKDIPRRNFAAYGVHGAYGQSRLQSIVLSLSPSEANPEMPHEEPPESS